MDNRIKEDYIREMEMEEIPECVNVIRTAFKTVADELGFTRENAPRFTAFATDDTRLQYQFLVEHKPMYVYLHEGKIVGYYSLAMLENGSVELNNLSVLPEFRHLGIGEKLVKDAIEKAKSFDKEKMELGIVEENKKLRMWYESLGFIHTGTKKFDFFPFTCGYMEMKL
ncbi:MAG: GNAT family N-acetyltransferase [Lachnospiraceae bacterium]|nr:GNAT family N-acetyltransferase [Lachnospiraceae bacterium]